MTPSVSMNGHQALFKWSCDIICMTHLSSDCRMQNARVFNFSQMALQLFVNANFVGYSMLQIWIHIMKLNTLGQPCIFLLRQSKRSWTVAGWHCTANEVGGTIFVDLVLARSSCIYIIYIVILLETLNLENNLHPCPEDIRERPK